MVRQCRRPVGLPAEVREQRGLAFSSSVFSSADAGLPFSSQGWTVELLNEGMVTMLAVAFFLNSSGNGNSSSSSEESKAKELSRQGPRSHLLFLVDI
jgi:hypothetical protein